MPTRILGISAYYHDSAACLVEDGRIVAAAQEERFTRKKHDAGFPVACRRVLPARGGHHGRAIWTSSASTRSRSSSSTRLLETYVACAPRGLKSYLMAMPLWLSDKLWMADDIREQLEGYEGEILFGEHHESHAASAFYPSPFEQAAIVTMDGVGEWATSSIGVGRGHEIELLQRAAVSAFARPAVFGLHLFHRLQGELGRVQGDGPRALRRAEVRPGSSRTICSRFATTAACG